MMQWMPHPDIQTMLTLNKLVNLWQRIVVY